VLYLKAANQADAEAEFDALTHLPSEHGFTNVYAGMSREIFMTTGLAQLLNNPTGINLPNGYVPETDFFLWSDDHIVGLFKVRHYLTPALRHGAGHIGYAILPAFRGRGYANRGLALAIQEARQIIHEDEIYLSVHRNNPASLAVQLKNGAVIAGENGEEYFTRIKL
jgi:predicted acetyltransferase